MAANEDFRSRYLKNLGITKRDESSDALASGGEASGSRGAELASSLTDGSSEEVIVVTHEAEPQAQPRAADDFRIAYIDKLRRSRAFIPQLTRPKSAQTVTIFDWDDTLMATTHAEILMQHLGNIPATHREQLKPLERASHAVLTLAMQLGRVVIITNATDGWVQHSAGMCMPAVRDLLVEKGIQVISARGNYEQAFPGDVHAWKIHAFLEVQRSLNMEAVTNLISIGDSTVEMEAVHVMGNAFTHSLVKTIKLWERPTPHELVKQLETVHGKLPGICSSISPMNIWMERDNKAAAAPPAPPPS
jgi:hypothetical protein